MPLLRGRVCRAAIPCLLGWLLALTGCEAPVAFEQLTATQGPIIGGTLDTAHKGVVSLLKQVQGGFAPACSGTLLTQNLVLTARHCVAPLNSADGATVVCDQTEFEQTSAASTLLVSVESKVGREGLDPYRVQEVRVPSTGSSVCGGDIALLVLRGSGVPTGAAQPIEPALGAEVAPETVFAAIGYGLQDPDDARGETAGQRMGVDDAKVFCTGLACQSELITAGEWIADSPVCSGDSGGPALDPTGRVMGVTSRGDPDCTVGIYTSVYAWRDFIAEGALAAAKAGGYTPPLWAGAAAAGAEPSSGGGGGNASSSAGGSTAGALPAAPSPAEPLGAACSGPCTSDYECWSESGEAPGICVPECSGADAACPSGYLCSTTLSVCLPERAPAASGDDDGGGCSVTTPAKGGKAPLFLVATLALFGFARRRRGR